MADSSILWRLRQQAITVGDCEDFRRALEVWTPFVAMSRNTPRAVKRFGNWIGYLAMLQQGAAEDRTVAQQMLDGLADWWRQVAATGRSRSTGGDSQASGRRGGRSRTSSSACWPVSGSPDTRTAAQSDGLRRPAILLCRPSPRS